MARLRTQQSGIAHLAFLLVLVVAVAVAVVAMRVAGNHADTSITPAAVSKTKVPAKFASKADISKASTALDATNVDGGVNPNALDQDLNSIL